MISAREATVCMQLDDVYEGECVSLLQSGVPDKTVDMCYADPPYNLSGKALGLPNNTTGGPYHKMNEIWDVMSAEQYSDFTGQWVDQVYRVLKDGGSLYTSCTFHSIADVITAGRRAGFRLLDVLTWYKPNAMPSITRRMFTYSTEFVCWFVKGSRWTYNYAELKKLSPDLTRDGKRRQLRDFISIPVVQGRERLHGETGRALHPTQKPERLLEIVITASSHEGGLVLDPFFGTGTTGVVARRLHRHFIGMESDPIYVRAARKRLFEENVGGR